VKKLILIASASAIAVGMLAAIVPDAEAGSGKTKSSAGWSQRLDPSKRFTVLEAFGDEAVLDNETGLVWEQMPSANTFTWASAQFRCNGLDTGGRRGWRLPALQELASLVDATDLDALIIDLPPGHPFDQVQAAQYWSATVSASFAGGAWYVDFSDDGETGFELASDRFRVWCVRTGAGVDVQ
jgi:hypothetical protein